MLIVGDWMRKICYFFFIFSISFNVKAQDAKITDYGSQHKMVNRLRVPSIDGKPIKLFLSNPQIDKHSKLFYKGELALVDDSLTLGLIDSALTSNSEIRPFYFFIFNRIMNLSEESNSSYLASICRKFISLYPCDFFEYLNSSDLDINVVKWNTFLGSQFSSRVEYDSFRGSLEQRMRVECSMNQDLWKSFFSETRTCVPR